MQDGLGVLVITDTGVGTDVARYSTLSSCSEPGNKNAMMEDKNRRWNIATFISHHLDPTKSIPQLVILSHCHYDHILGLAALLESRQISTPVPSARVQILASPYDTSFVTPYTVLAEHSLCNSVGLACPKYEVTYWAEDEERIVYKHPDGGETGMELPIIILHTPGHTPDSLTWFDTEERVLYVGDSFYGQTSPDSETAPWGPEGSAPILFPNEGNLADWWESVDKLLQFVAEQNHISTATPSSNVKLSAGHVTANEDAETILVDVKRFMTKILRNEAKFEEMPTKRGEKFGMWTEEGGRFSLGAPVRVVEEGGKKIPRGKWAR
jgi:glyoxylase-like metal-dependent hydrolase (beta-lactamase superfamily II)